MRREVVVTALPGKGPRVLLLPGLGARGRGFAALAERLGSWSSPSWVDYPESRWAAVGPDRLADEVFACAGPVDLVVASSYGGLVAAHLVHSGATRAVAFVGSFLRPSHLGWRQGLLRRMGEIALWGRPGVLSAMVASAGWVPLEQACDVVPTTLIERDTVRFRVGALTSESLAPPLVDVPGLRCLVIQGGRDLLVPPSTVPRLMADLPPGTELVTLPDAGHVPYFSHPDELSRLLERWHSTFALSSPPAALPT